MLFRLVLLIFTLVVIQGTAKQPRSIPKYTDWRLPHWVLPRHYKLRLLPFIEEGNFTIDGQVDILLECMEPTTMIVLHMAEIRIAKDEGLQVTSGFRSDYVWDEFQKTLPMSTYILAFIVSEFEGLDSPEIDLQDRTTFRTWTMPSAKIDMFAIPDFAVSAMENWGLITYRSVSFFKPVSLGSALGVYFCMAHFCVDKM